MSERYKKFKMLGLCRRCGEEPLPGKTRCHKCHEAHLNYSKLHKEKAIKNGLCRYCCKAESLTNKTMCAECLASHSAKEKHRNQNNRQLCIEKYGGMCQCCGLAVPKYLQLDHVLNDGAEHRRELASNGRGGNLYKWAVANDFPDRLQLLCANCHQAKTCFGGCTEEDHRSMRNAYQVSTHNELQLEQVK